MKVLFFVPLLIFFISSASARQNKLNLSQKNISVISEKLKPFFSASKAEIEDLLKGEVISTGKVDSPSEKEQQLFLFVSGIHPRSCERAMRKLSLYESYPLYISFIKTSSYDDSTQNFSFTIEHTLLPFAMIVRFKIPRITKPGHYPFIFESGFLKDLKGIIILENIENHCLLALKTDWRGPSSSIPNLVFGTFIQTVGKIGLEHLIRVSLF